MSGGVLRTSVLIVGGGPVGLALAVELGHRGIPALLVERNSRHARQPRAKTTNVRSMEHMRRWGIAERIREASPLPEGFPTDIIFRTRLFGRDLATIGNAFFGAPGRNELYSEHAQWIPQYKVEGVLRDHAATLPSVSLRFGMALEGLRQDAEGVEAELLDEAGERLRVRADYLVGADGSRSTVRGMIGARMEGEHAYAQNYNLVIRAPALREAFAGGRSIMYWLVNPDCAAIAGPMDLGDTWYFGFPVPNGTPPLTEAELQARMTAAFGRDVGAEVLTVDTWAAHSLIADRYRDGRVFLAGDACHLHPPFGGYGMNLGIADGVDLGWKLAARLQGWGGEALLEGYEAERRPVHRRVIEEAVANYAVLAPQLLRPGLEADGAEGEAARAEVGALILAHKPREFRTLGVVLGSHYSGSPLTVPDGSAPPPAAVTEYVPSAHPGCLAPHLWLEDGHSLYDLFGAGFTLLVTDAAGDGGALRRAAERLGVPLDVVAPGDARLAALYGARFALVRPDGHVAWRGDGIADAEGVLRIVCGLGKAAREPMPAHEEEGI
ncbi:FAD-dependent monooxygenase [Roseomonas populi]|uniref:FAD-dependent monooxygenase n=1 Tax=Roseomonas populi TaxID=3121582 RepID=A0ABT1XBV9_9PROT|nr:FAD-dependent monooxygenase [Roseomonas pecuniae]MCR0985620.1 FAD-dependent monooxygenase [Roseomonas pecuniae]